MAKTEGYPIHGSTRTGAQEGQAEGESGASEETAPALSQESEILSTSKVAPPWIDTRRVQPLTEQIGAIEAKPTRHGDALLEDIPQEDKAKYTLKLSGIIARRTSWCRVGLRKIR